MGTVNSVNFLYISYIFFLGSKLYIFRFLYMYCLSPAPVIRVDRVASVLRAPGEGGGGGDGQTELPAISESTFFLLTHRDCKTRALTDFAIPLCLLYRAKSVSALFLNRPGVRTLFSFCTTRKIVCLVDTKLFADLWLRIAGSEKNILFVQPHVLNLFYQNPEPSWVYRKERD